MSGSALTEIESLFLTTMDVACPVFRFFRIPSKSRGNAISITLNQCVLPSLRGEKVPEGRMRVSSDGTHLADMLLCDKTPLNYFNHHIQSRPSLILDRLAWISKGHLTRLR